MIQNRFVPSYFGPSVRASRSRRTGVTGRPARAAVVAFAAAACVVWSSPAGAVVVHVPGDYPTIQQAVNATFAGDTIIVAPGLHDGAQLNGRMPSIRGTDPNDPGVVAATAIDGGILILGGGEPGTARIAGLTFLGDGVEIESLISSARLVLSQNVFQFCGDAVKVRSDMQGDVRIINNTFSDGLSGVSSSAPGAVYVFDNLIEWNDLGLEGSFTEIEGNTVRNNLGNGVVLERAAKFGRNLVTRNFGVGVRVNAADAVSVHNNIIVRNRDGLILGARTAAENNTVVAHTGFGVRLSGSGTDRLRNSIAYANGTSLVIPGGTLNVTYCCFDATVPGTGNLNADPLFLDPAGGDFHLTSASPCINAGTPSYDWTISVVDFDDDLRVMGGRVDIGADETILQTSIIRGDVNGDGIVDARDIQALVNLLLAP